MLYHASTNKDLTSLEPKRTLSRDVYIGDYVFATSDYRLAAMYLVTRGRPILLNVKESIPRIVICSNAKEYIESDTGGAIYTLPGETFHKTPQEGLEDSELVSEVAVKTVSKKVYETSLAALKEAGVEIYFVGEEQFDGILSNKNEAEIVTRFSPYQQ
ncbi:hypothetical protein BH23PAT2_BH23PAT2_02560 [soil metagenome]